MLISHRHRFIFVKTRKTGGTSLEIALSTLAGPADVVTSISPEDEALRREHGGRGPQNERIPLRRWGPRGWARAALGRPNVFFNHMPARDIRRHVAPEVWRGYYKFTIERNPWDIALSAYPWHHRHGPPASLAEFVASDALAGYSNWPLYAIDGAVAVDEVLRYESLAESLPALAARLGLPGIPPLPRAKAGFRTDRRHYAEVLGKAERERIARVFAREIAAFDWRFD
jgi:hypothetical protein